MSNPFDAIQPPVRDLHQQAGWPGTVYSYTPDDSGGGEWYDDTGGGDGGWIENNETVTIRVETSTSPSVIRGAGGREITGDAAITVDPTEHSGGADAFTAGDGDDRKATEVLDGDSDKRYRTTRVNDEHTGVLVLDCELLP
jgi:hypothetical protein